MKQFQEVAPPGWGHTKAEKEKTKPDKPKSKIGGSAAAFKRALDDGRFKGLPGDKTYKDKKESMFKLMWSMKKKGSKPHYKPGTDEKYKKYQEEEVVLEKDLNPAVEIAKIRLEKKKKEDAKKKKAKVLAKSKQRATGNLKKHDTDGDGYVRVIDAGYKPEGEVVQEKDLNAAERRALPDSDFALPGKGEGPKGKQAGSYPIPDEKHARSALSLVAQHGTPAEKATVRAKVKKKFPNIEQNEDWKPEIEVIDTKKEAKKREKKRKEAESSLPPHLRLDTMKKAFAHTNESAVLDVNKKLQKKDDRKKLEKEYVRLMKVMAHKKRMKELGLGEEKDQVESFEIDKTEHKKKQKERKMRNLSIGNPNKNEADVAHKKAGGPKLAFEGWREKARDAMKRVVGKKDAPKHDFGRDAGAEAKKRLRKKDHETVNFLDPDD